MDDGDGGKYVASARTVANLAKRVSDLEDASRLNPGGFIGQSTRTVSDLVKRVNALEASEHVHPHDVDRWEKPIVKPVSREVLDSVVQQTTGKAPTRTVDEAMLKMALETANKTISYQAGTIRELRMQLAELGDRFDELTLAKLKLEAANKALEARIELLVNVDAER
jgi:hypothetical protein